jgi:hypothetical protein
LQYNYQLKIARVFAILIIWRRSAFRCTPRSGSCIARFVMTSAQAVVGNPRHHFK